MVVSLEYGGARKEKSSGSVFFNTSAGKETETMSAISCAKLEVVNMNNATQSNKAWKYAEVACFFRLTLILISQLPTPKIYSELT